MKFEFWRAFGQWYWHLKAGNGEIVATGEGYKRKAEVLNVIRLIRTYAADATQVQLKERVL